MLAPTVTSFLAQTPPPNGELVFLAYLIGGLLTLLTAAQAVVFIWDKTRRKPPLDQTFATKLELEESRQDRMAIRQDLRALDERTEKKIEALDRRREADNKDARDLIYREVGEMKDFIADKISENRANNQQQFGTIFGRLDSFQVTMQGLSNDVMHQVGSLDGQLKEVSKRVT